MKKSAMVTVLVVGFLLITVVPSFAWWQRGWWGPPYPYWYGPRYYVLAPAPLLVTPPPVVEAPPGFVQQEPMQGHRYSCPSSQTYYPNVRPLPDAWVKV